MIHKDYFLCSYQQIPWKFWQRVVNVVGDKYIANRIFFRAEQAKAKNVIRWVSKGLSKDTPYCLRASTIEATPQGKAIVDKWIAERIEGTEAVARGMAQFKEIMKEMLK